MKKKLISVIVPVYNVKKYLEQCVYSIVSQTYDELEILLIDDGSTDGSDKLCDEIKKIDKRIYVYHKENGGLSDARNFGIERSKGDFYAFIDSDDALHKDFFRILIQTQEKYDADIVGCDMSLYQSVEELPQLFDMEYVSSEKVFDSKGALSEYFLPSGKRIIYHGLCMKIYNRELFRNVRFDVGRLHEDLYITYRLLDMASKVAYVDAPYYFYFQNNTGSICKNYSVKNYLDEAEAYRRIYNYFELNNRVSDELIHFLIIQYLLMFEKGYNIRNDMDIKKLQKQLQKWVRDNIKRCNSFGTIKKMLILISLKNIKFYSFLKKIKN